MNRGILGILVIMVTMGVGSAVWAATQIYELKQSESQVITLPDTMKRALVANPEVAKIKVLERNKLLVTGHNVGRTELIVWFKRHPEKDVHYTIVVRPDTAMKAEIEHTVSELIKLVAPNSKVTFEVRSIWMNAQTHIQRMVDVVGNEQNGTGSVVKSDRDEAQLKGGQNNGHAMAGNYLVILKGSVPSRAVKKRLQSLLTTLGVSLINMVSVTGPKQIRLSVRVAEVSKGNPFKYGLSLRDKRDHWGLFPPGNLGSAASVSLAGGLISSATVPFPQPDGFQIGFNPKGESVFGVLSILEGHNLARVLAKPELIVQDGKQASFLVGGQVPIPVPTQNGNVAVEYKDFGINLVFEPHITSDGKIRLKVAPEVSEVDISIGAQYGTTTVPGFRTRKAETTITLAPGESFVIAGLYQNNINSVLSKLPVLGDLPVLGALFRSSSFQQNRSELAILVTPTFITPFKPTDAVSLPGERLKAASIGEQFWFGRNVKKVPLPNQTVEYGLE